MSDPVDDEFETAEAERACLELKGQIARARRVLDEARQMLGGGHAADENEAARP